MARIQIHYRRLCGDYIGWQMWVWPIVIPIRAAPDEASKPAAADDAGASQVGGVAVHPVYNEFSKLPSVDAFGALYEINIEAGSWLDVSSLGVIPRWGEWKRQDDPARQISQDIAQLTRGTTVHVYVIEDEEDVAMSLESFGDRFVHLTIPALTSGALLYLWTFDCVRCGREVFAGDRRTNNDNFDFLLDRMQYRNGDIDIEVLNAADEEPAKRTSLTWTLEHGARVQVDLNEQKLVKVLSDALSSTTPARLSAGETPPSPASSTSTRWTRRAARRLIVRYQRLDADFEGLLLGAWEKDRPASKRLILSRLNEGRHVTFEVTLSDGRGDEQALCMRVEKDAAVSTAAAHRDVTFEWTPSLGLELFLLEGADELIPRRIEEFPITYHRYGEMDHSEWQLCATTSAWQKMHSAEEAEVLLSASPTTAPNSVSFDLSSLYFPAHSEVVLTPVRSRAITIDDGDSEGKTKVIRSEVMRDVQRRVPVSRLDDGHLHIVQGASKVRLDAPGVEAMSELRFATILYRIIHPAERAEWDLWCWDEEDRYATGNAASVDVAPPRRQEGERRSSEYIHCTIDRARCGVGQNLLMIGRRGGARWLAKDEPPRRLTCSNDRSKDRSFLMLQGYPELVHRMDHAKVALTAYVDRDGSILLQTNLPCGWVVPGRERMEYRTAARGGRAKELTIQSAAEVAPLRHVLRVAERSKLMDEDFSVDEHEFTIEGFATAPLQWRRFENHDEYYYDGELGCVYDESQCVFRCFAPSAQKVSVVLYPQPTSDTGRRVYSMRRIMEGCWKLVIDGDLRGKFYKLLAEGESELLFPGVEVMDPYARCTTAHDARGRALIFGRDETSVADRPAVAPRDLIVYEVHVRDATIDRASGVKRRGKFLGLTESGTRLDGQKKDVATALDHILEMGVNAVQIMPIQDFDNDESSESEYRWGYMPVHFNSPDGWYATERHTSARVSEFKRLVDCFHRHGVKVIMDVVYNHTSEDANERNLKARFSFNGIAPRYYYRNCVSHPIAASGHNTCAFRGIHEPHCGSCYSNGSGCGNEFRSESPMGRKFILDSLRYWAEEYKIDGFRFDLLGLIDVETLTLASKMLRGIDENIVLYGEPWTGGLSPVEPTAKGKQRGRGFGVFNDTFRDALRGSSFGVQETYLMDGGNVTAVQNGIFGSINDFAANPTETINYIECHDNRTLYDQFCYYSAKREDSIDYKDADYVRMAKLGAVILFISQGIPFVQIGQEMCRTKNGVENSYESPDDINMIHWNWKIKRFALITFFKNLIQIRKSQRHLFCLPNAEAIRESAAFLEDLGCTVPACCIAVRYKATSDACVGKSFQDKWRAAVVVLNPTPMDQLFELPLMYDEVAWWIPVVDDKAAGSSQIGQVVSERVVVRGRSAMMFRLCSHDEAITAQKSFRLQFVSDPYASAD